VHQRILRPRMNANERGSGIVEEGRGWQLALSDSIRDDLNGEALGVANRFFACLAVAHDARQLERLGNPAAVFFAIEIDRQVHFFRILRDSAVCLQPARRLAD